MENRHASASRHHHHSRTRIEVRPTAELRVNYLPLDVLGKGQYGVVWRCRDRHSGREFACKRVSRSACGEKAYAAARREIEIMAKLRGKGCGHVIGLEAVFADSDSLYLLMELGTGGDLLTRIQEVGMLGEVESRNIFASVSRSVKECHDNSVIHRDIKPENILLFPGKSTATEHEAPGVSPNRSQSSSTTGYPQHAAKLADFGLSLELPRWQQVVGYAGSYPYEAPEVMAQEPYDESADIWSLGVLLYAMLSGTWPLFRNNVRELDSIADWEAPCWSSISAEAQNLIRQMLSVDPLTRPTIDQVLADAWLAVPPASPSPPHTFPPSVRFAPTEDTAPGFPDSLPSLVALSDVDSTEAESTEPESSEPDCPEPDSPEPDSSALDFHEPASQEWEESNPEARQLPVSQKKSSPRGKHFSSPKQAAAALKRHVVPTCLPFKMRAGGGGRRGSSRVAPTAVSHSVSADGLSGITIGGGGGGRSRVMAA